MMACEFLIIIVACFDFGPFGGLYLVDVGGSLVLGRSWCAVWHF